MADGDWMINLLQGNKAHPLLPLPNTVQPHGGGGTEAEAEAEDT